MQNFLPRPFLRVFLAASLTAAAWAQTPPPPNTGSTAVRSAASGVVHGTIKDDSGGIIPGATVTLTSKGGAPLTATTGSDGSFSLHRVPPGAYDVTATYTNMQQQAKLSVTVAPGQQATANIVMAPQEQKQEITVTDTVTNQVSTDAAANSSALVLKQEDLDALPDDPDDMQADLEALAGPSAGPGGAQIYIDGFTGGRLPPKASIREIRINSNPFSAEFDKLGFGRIQIFTKPGSDKFHGQSYYDISDGIWNSRNPFLSNSPPFRTQLFGGNVSGPISKHASFFVDVERRDINDNGIITATIPTANFLGSQSYQNYFSTPQHRTTFSPRIDYQLGANNTLSFRYDYLDNVHQISNIGAFNLPSLTLGDYTFPSNGDKTSTLANEIQVVETAVLNPRVVNESHFEFRRTTENTSSLSTAPELDVAQSFVTGGSGYSAPGTPATRDVDSYYELQNYTSVTWGAHVTKFGVRMRSDWINDTSPTNFNGEYAFLGGTFNALNSSFAPTGATERLTSIQQFLITEQLLQAGYSSGAVAQLGYGPSKFTINQGLPSLQVDQVDAGPFINDDWRIRPNLTVSAGIRYEVQTNIGDYGDVAPRIGFAWAPGGGSPTGLSRPKTVIRGGWGYFYDRFALDNVLNAYRYARNGGSQITYTVDNPTSFNGAFNTTPPQSELTATASQYYQIDPNLKAPRLMQTVIGIDRQLLSHTTLSVNVIDSRGTHELLTDDINAPFAIPGELPPGTSTVAGATTGLTNTNSIGVRPYGNIGDIYDYQSTGIYKQLQAMVNLNSQLGKRITLFTRYSYQQAHSDTDGLSTMPSDPYNIAADWGRSALDIHHQFFLGGSILAPWGLRFSPFVVAHSGTPFNITTGTDLFLEGNVAPTARPEPVAAGTPLAIDTPIGYLNPYPIVGAPLIQRNFATGPGFIGINLRVSKTWGFGTTKFEGPSGGARAGGGGFGGGGRGGRGGGGGGFFGGPGESSEHRFNLTASLNGRNILNHENLNTPNGSITSPYFLESTGITGGFGAEATASNQRRLDMQLRFTF